MACLLVSATSACAYWDKAREDRPPEPARAEAPESALESDVANEPAPPTVEAASSAASAGEGLEQDDVATESVPPGPGSTTEAVSARSEEDTSEPSAAPLGEDALVPVAPGATQVPVSPDVAEPAEAGASVAAVAPTPVVAAPTEPPPAEPVPIARLQRGSRVLGADFVEPARGESGAIDDLLIDPATGEVLAVVVTLSAAGGDATVQRLHDLAGLDWTEHGAGLALAPHTVEAAGIEDGGAEPALVLDYAQVFDGRDVTSVSGEISEREAPVAELAVVLKVRDPENLLHRVLVQPANLVMRTLPQLEPEQRVTVEGVFTRDATGKLLVASAVTQKGRTLRLRDASGALVWKDLVAGVLPARGLAGTSLALADGSGAIVVVDWVLDRERGTIGVLYANVEGVPRELPWSLVELGADGAGSVALDEEGARGLPAVPPLGDDADPR